MRIKEGYMINKLGDGYVVVTVGDASREFNGLIRLNDTGAFLWESVLNGLDTKKKLTQAMMNYYDDLDEEEAEKDLAEFLEMIAFAIEEGERLDGGK